jgi:hypothetical protein
MRWPLRRQIMLPMAAIMLLAVLVIGGLGAYLSARAAKSRIAAQIAGVTRIVAQSNFPLTDAELPVVGAASRAAHVAASLRDAVPSFGETPLPGGPARLAGPTATLYS